MLLCLCFPSAALTLDNRLGLSEDELEELSLTESMEDGDALETYLEHEEDRYPEHEEDLAQLEEMEVQDPNVKARRRKTRARPRRPHLWRSSAESRVTAACRCPRRRPRQRRRPWWRPPRRRCRGTRRTRRTWKGR